MLLHRSERMKSNYCCYATGVIRAWRMQLQTNLTTDLLLLTGLLQAYLAEALSKQEATNCASAFVRSF